MHVASDAIENNTRQVQRGVEGFEAKGHGADAARGFGGSRRPAPPAARAVWRAGLCCPLRRPRGAIVQPHHTLDHRHILADHGALKQLLDGLDGEQPAIEVATRHAADHAVVGGVDVVRANLERLDLVAARRQGTHDGRGDGSFSHATGGAGDDNGFHAHSCTGYGRKYVASAAGGHVQPGRQRQLQRGGGGDEVVKEVRVHHLGQDFQPGDNARTGPAEIIMLDHIDFTPPHRLAISTIRLVPPGSVVPVRSAPGQTSRG